MDGARRLSAKQDGRWLLAVEQAGSAVVSLARGRRVEIITLRRRMAGRHADPTPHFRGRLSPPGKARPRTQRTVEDEVMALLAGPAAVRQASGERAAGATPEDDYQLAVDIAREFSGTLEEAETFVAHLEEQTVALLADERRWECVEILAELLLERGAIDGRDARFVFQQVVFAQERSDP